MKKQALPMRAQDARSLLAHALDARHLKRYSRDPVKTLEEPLRLFRESVPITSQAGKPFVYPIPGSGGEKIVGQIDAQGWIVPRSFYGKGQPHDKRRPDVDITQLLVRKPPEPPKIELKQSFWEGFRSEVRNALAKEASGEGEAP